MGFIKENCTSESLKEFHLPQMPDDAFGGSIDIYRRLQVNVVLICRSYIAGREIYRELFLFIGNKRLNVEENFITYFESGQSFFKIKSFTITSSYPLNKYELRKIKKYGKGALDCYLENKPKNQYKLLIVDETQLAKPKSITKLKSILNDAVTCWPKECFINEDAMSRFISIRMSEEEANRLYAYIRSKKGTGLSLKALLLFELVFEKHRKWQFQSHVRTCLD